MPLEYNLETMITIHPDELDKLELALDSSGLDKLELAMNDPRLDEPTKKLFSDVIANGRTLIGLVGRLRETPEDSRDEIFQEIAELLGKNDSLKNSLNTFLQN